MNASHISNLFTTDDARWDRAAYVQDDWKVNQRLTVNLGVRYEYFQPYYDRHGNQAMFYPTSLTPGHGTGKYLIPKKNANVPLSPIFTSLLATDGIDIVYSDNPSLREAQHLNFAPRIGFAFRPNDKTVIRGGYGNLFRRAGEHGLLSEPRRELSLRIRLQFLLTHRVRCRRLLSDQRVHPRNRLL